MTIQANQWLLWLLLTILLYVALVILVPKSRVKAYIPYGLLLGFGQAIIIIWLFQFYLQNWALIGDPVIFGFSTVFTPLAWIPPTIIFAAFFPKNKRWYHIIGYILLFAVGAVGTQFLLEQLGMWQSIRWSLLWTGLLATATHSILTIALLATKARVRT